MCDVVLKRRLFLLIANGLDRSRVDVTTGRHYFSRI